MVNKDGGTIFGFYGGDIELMGVLPQSPPLGKTLPTKVETKGKLQQFTVSGWLIINGGASDSEKKRTLRLKSYSQYEVSVQ